MRRRQNPQAKHARQIGATERRNAVEQKQVDITNATLAIPSASAAWSSLELLNGIGTGVLTSQRVGRRVSLQKLAVRWIMSAANGLYYAPFRIMVVYDKAPNGVLPAITEILNANTMLGQVNLNNTDRFMILKDLYPCERGEQGYGAISIGGVGAGHNGQAGKFTIKFNPPLQEQFLLSNNLIADISTGAIYLMWCMTGSQTTSAGSFVLSFSSRVRYTDA